METRDQIQEHERILGGYPDSKDNSNRERSYLDERYGFAQLCTIGRVWKHVLPHAQIPIHQRSVRGVRGVSHLVWTLPRCLPADVKECR